MSIVTAVRGNTFPNITVTGQSTLSGQPYMRRFMTSNASISNNTVTDVNFDALTGSIVGDLTYSNPSITVPTAGLYLICVSLTYVASAAGSRAAYLNLAGTQIVRQFAGNAGAADVAGVVISHITNITAGQTFKIQTLQDSGGALNLGGGTDLTWLTMYRLA